MPQRSTAATVVTVALALSACGGGSDNAVTTVPPLSAGEPSVESAPVPTEPADIEPLTTTTSTTEPSTTTTEPSTTTVPSVEDQVRAAAARTYGEYWECLRAPENCDPGRSNLPGSDAFNAQTRTNTDLVEGGLYVGEEDPGYMVVESIEIKDDHTAVTSCWRLTAVLYFQPPIEGQPATVQNNTPGYSRQVDEFVQDPDDDLWKIRRSDLIEQEANVNDCPAEEP